jgi:hypothetical protein
MPASPRRRAHPLQRSNAQHLIQAFKPTEFHQGMFVIKQGDEGDYCYLLDEVRHRTRVHRAPDPHRPHARAGLLPVSTDA